jgi:hypothetical protein
MRLVAIEIPDEPADLAPWLERVLVGPDLGALIAELEAVHGDPSGVTISANTLIGPDLAAVLDGGLSKVPLSKLKQLLRQPRLLLDLQELIFGGGQCSLGSPGSRGGRGFIHGEQASPHPLDDDDLSGTRNRDSSDFDDTTSTCPASSVLDRGSGKRGDDFDRRVRIRQTRS